MATDRAIEAAKRFLEEAESIVRIFREELAKGAGATEYWCCGADFGQHTKDCPNYKAVESSVCPRCEGTGKYQRIPFPEKDCAICGGTGKITDEPAGEPPTPRCPVCGAGCYLESSTSMTVVTVECSNGHKTECGELADFVQFFPATQPAPAEPEAVRLLREAKKSLDDLLSFPVQTRQKAEDVSSTIYRFLAQQEGRK